MATNILSRRSVEVGDVWYVDDGVGGVAFRPRPGMTMTIVGHIVDGPTLDSETTDTETIVGTDGQAKTLTTTYRFDSFTLAVPQRDRTAGEGPCIISFQVFSSDDLLSELPPRWVQCARPGSLVEVTASMDPDDVTRLVAGMGDGTAFVGPSISVKVFEDAPEE